MANVRIRKEMPGVELSEQEFKTRYRERFYDPAFRAREDEIERIAEVAWRAYSESRKAPHTRRAGTGFADPDYELSVEWIAARDRIDGGAASAEGSLPHPRASS